MHLFSRRPTQAPTTTNPARTESLDANPCGWFASSAELSRGLSVIELEIATEDFAATWRRWSAAPAGGARNPACHAGARG